MQTSVEKSDPICVCHEEVCVRWDGEKLEKIMKTRKMKPVHIQCQKEEKEKICLLLLLFT